MRVCFFRATSFLLLGMMAAFLKAQITEPRDFAKLTPAESLGAGHTLFLRGDCDGARKHYLDALASYPRDFDLLKNLAHCYFSTKPPALDQAARYYARAYEINPASREVAERLAQCDMALGRYNEAAQVLTQLTRLPGAPGDVWKRAAESYEAMHRVVEAEAAYDAHLQRKPADLEARSNLAHLYSWQKAYDKALEQFRIVLAANPNFVPGLIGMARVLSWQGQLKEAWALYDHALRLEPENDEGRAGKAFVLLWMGRAEEAQALFKVLHRRHPQDTELAKGLEDAEAAIEKGVLAQARQTGDFSRVESYYRNRLNQDPEDLRALKILAKFNTGPDHCVSGIAYARKATELSDDPSFDLLLARSLVSCQDYSEAIARYHRFIEFQPESRDALAELGDALMREHRFAEAEGVFRRLLSASPQNADASAGLARALAVTGNYAEALARYDEALEISPKHYDALQGKANVLYYTGKLAEARAIFQDLAERQPVDRQNAEALANIDRAEDAARWAALRPPPGAPPQEFLTYFQKWLARHPDDKAALKGLAYLEAQLNRVPQAIRDYRRALEIDPGDRDSKAELARLLFQNHEYGPSIEVYRNMLSHAPEDSNTLENLARAYSAAGEDRNALAAYRRLVANHSSETRYRFEAARLELELGDAEAARDTLKSLLALEPENRRARLQLAEIDMKQGQLDEAQRQFDRLLSRYPFDSEALLGRARVSYYQGDLRAARQAVTTLLEGRPANVEAILVLASVEHARGRRRGTLSLLERAAQVSPGNPEVAAMRERVAHESSVTLHTYASFAREIGAPTESLDVRGVLHAGLPNADLRSFTYATTIGLPLLPRTESAIDLIFMPSASPPGPLRDANGNQIPTGITGTAAPSEFLYRQTTQLSRQLIVRAGVGLARFGTGAPVGIPGDPDPIASAASRLIGLAGFTNAPTKKLSFDFDAARSPIAYTPIAVRLGVTEDRVTGRVNLLFNRRMELHVEYYAALYSTARIRHVIVTTHSHPFAENQAAQDRGRGGSVVFKRSILSSERFSLDAGYSGRAYGFDKTAKDIFLGFYNPAFYQSHLATWRFFGKLRGPLSYDLSGGLGLERTQLDPAPMSRIYDVRGHRVVLDRTPTRPALIVSPSLTCRVSPRLSLTAGYTHYTTAQSIGTLRGNAVQLSADWKF